MQLLKKKHYDNKNKQDIETSTIKKTLNIKLLSGIIYLFSFVLVEAFGLKRNKNWWKFLSIGFEKQKI